MKQSSSDEELEKLTPLLRIVKQREQLYLQLLGFVSKNIQSSSSQHEQLSLFTKFLQTIKIQQKQILIIEKTLISYFEVQNLDDFKQDNQQVVTHVVKNNKQILRLCSRLIEILDTSVSKTRKSIFNENGRISLEFSRFKRNLHNIVKGQTVHLGQFTNHILNYIRIKYKKQIAKVQKYIFKLQSGALIALRDLYYKQKSDVSSPDQKQQQTYRNNLRQSVKKIQQSGSESESPIKRSLKKSSLKSSRKGTKLLKSSLKKQRQNSVNSDCKPPKQYTANKIFKLYVMMDLSKKQFLQDYIYQKNIQQEQRKKLLNSLLQKNKIISSQISTYYRKCQPYFEKIKQLEINNFMKSSGQQKQKKNSSQQKNSIVKNTSLRKSFVISKRKSSLTFQKSSKILTQNDQTYKHDPFNKTIKNFPVRRKSSGQTSQRNKSKKLFVIKSPVVFQDDNIPQASNLNPSGWFRAPLTTRKTQKKNQNIRLKRRNNPLPMEKSLFNETFKFTQNQL